MGGPCRKVDIEEVDPFITLGDMAMVWDGEIAGMAEGGTEGRSSSWQTPGNHRSC